MGSTERAKERKSLLGKLFGRKEPSNEKCEPEPPLEESGPELSEEELAAIEAERERVAQELVQREKDSMVRATGSCLYKIYQAYHGLSPVTDDEGAYSLAVFTGNNDLPTDEERELLKELDRHLYYTYKQASGSMEPERDSPDSAVTDATCHVLITGNALGAYLFVLPPQDGGNDFTRDDVTHALNAAELSFGIIDDCLEDIVRLQKYLQIIKIAEGLAPTDGEDGKVQDHFHRKIEIRLKERDDGTVDYRDLGWLQTAGAGDVICDIIPPIPAKDGTNVLGKPVSGNSGKEAVPPVGESVVMNDKGDKMLASIDGVVIFRDECFHVEPLLVIDSDVDTGVGNLNLIGSAIINGDVRGGYTIKATGNITVQGRVENAYVEAGGSIQIGNGMNGGDTGTLRAQGDIACRYIEHSTVYAGNSIVSDTIVNSNVSAGNSVEVSTGRGTIVGGRVAARNRIQAQTVGNYGNTLTSVILGDTLESVNERQELTDKSIELGRELTEKEKNLKYLGQRPVLNSSDRTKSNELKNSIRSLKSSLQDVSNRLAEIERRRPPNTGCYLRAGNVNPPLELTISGVRTTIRTGVSSVRFVMRSGEVVQVPF